MKLSELTKRRKDAYKEVCTWLQTDHFNTYEIDGKVHVDFGGITINDIGSEGYLDIQYHKHTIGQIEYSE